MRIKNEMETVVRQVLQRGKGTAGGGIWASSHLMEHLQRILPFLGGGGGGGRILCQCPLCSADIVALALSTLPSCYCRSDHYGLAFQSMDRKQIEARVEMAMNKVKMRPRHPDRAVVPAASQVRLVDFGLKEGSRMIGPLLKRLPEACACEQCQEDTLAFGLNRKPPKYGISVGGKLRIPHHQLEFFRHELLNVMAEAARKIALNPRHGGKDDL